MICDSIIHSHQYDVLSDRIADAFRWLRSTHFSNLADGRYELRGADLYIMLSTKQTKPVSEEKPEAHKKYLDIQFLFSIPLDFTSFVKFVFEYFI